MSVTQKWLTLLPFKKYIWDKIKITRLATGWFLFVWDLCSKSVSNMWRIAEAATLRCKIILRYQERGSRPVLDIYLNLLNTFARSANSANVSASPRTFTGIPVSAIAFSISSFEKSSSWEFFSPFTNVFLLWLKDARISLNISFSLSTCTGGSSYLTSWITALPTFGLGIKQFGGTFAMICGLA